MATVGRLEYSAAPFPLMAFCAPPWRLFRTLDSSHEAASAAACCNFSLATLEVACCRSGVGSFALTEQRRADAWRWAICSNEGMILYAGCEPTQTGAKKVAEEVLRREEA